MMTMSALSAQNFGVTPSNSQAVSAKKHAKHGEPTAVSAQPRETAPDTFEAQKPATEATTTATTTTETTTPAGAFPVVPVAGGAAAGAVVGGGGAALIFPEEIPATKGAAKVENNAYVATSDDFKVTDKSSVTEKKTGLTYALSEKDGQVSIGDVTSTKPIDGLSYTYKKPTTGTTTLTHEYTPANDWYHEIFGKDATKKATVEVTDNGVKVIPHTETKIPALEFNFTADKKGLDVASSLKTIIDDKTNYGAITEELINHFKEELTTKKFKVISAVDELGKTVVKSDVTEMIVHTGGEAAKKNHLGMATWIGAGLLGLAGAAAGFFLGKKKEEPATTTADATLPAATPTA
jgi:hypothetical protein